MDDECAPVLALCCGIDLTGLMFSPKWPVSLLDANQREPFRALSSHDLGHVGPSMGFIIALTLCSRPQHQPDLAAIIQARSHICPSSHGDFLGLGLHKGAQKS